MNIICVGLDWSMTSPALCVGDVNASFDQLHFYALDPKVSQDTDNYHISLYPSWNTAEERFDALAQWGIKCAMSMGKPAAACIEGYAYGAKGRMFEIGENGGVIKHSLYKQNIRIITLPPAIVKKYATGKGNANKEMMYEAFVQETGQFLPKILGYSDQFSGPISDIVDAYFIWKMSRELGVSNT